MKHRILTIEDQDDIRRLIRMTLEFKGFEVLDAPNGRDGLTMARQHRPDLILMDVMMPEMNGLSASEALAADPALKDIPVVMLSALGNQSDVSAGMATGVRAYLVKPFDPWELLELVNQLIRKDRSAANDVG